MPSTETKHLASLNFDLTQMQQQLASIPATVEQAAKAAQDAWNQNFSVDGSGVKGGATGGAAGSGSATDKVTKVAAVTKAQLESLTMSPVPKPIMDANGKEISLSEKEVGQFLQFFFSNRRLAEMESQSKRKVDRLFPNGKPITQAAIWRLKKTKRNYLFYCDNPNAMIIAMWLERKVSYRGRPIRFYDLERKFMLNKSEIERLICYLHELSGF